MNNSENIIIAEFIGMQKTDLGWYDAEEVLLNLSRNLTTLNDNTFDVLMFDKDWNWLICVVKHIAQIDDDIYENRLSYEITDAVLNDNITLGLSTILDYIKTN